MNESNQQRPNRMESTDSSDVNDRRLLGNVRPLIAAFMFLMLFISVAGFLLMLPTARNGHVDFRAFYAAGYMVRTGHGAAIYDYDQMLEYQNRLVGPAAVALPFNHLAYESLLHVPLSWLSYRQAYGTFLLFNVAVLIFAIRMMGPKIEPLRRVWSLLPVALPLCFLPVVMALINGQDSLLLLALFVSAFVVMDRGLDFQSGILVGFTLFKFQYALPIVFLFFVWRRWRFLAGFITAGAVVVGISALLLGPAGIVSYAHYLPGASSRFSAANEALLGIHPEGMPNLRGLAYMASGVSPSVTNILTVVLSCGVMLWAARWRPSLPGAVLAAMLVSYHQMISDTSLLLLPLGYLATQLLDGEIGSRKWLVIVVMVAFVGPSLLLFAGTRFYLESLPILTLFVLFPRFLQSSPNHRDEAMLRLQTETSERG